MHQSQTRLTPQCHPRHFFSGLRHHLQTTVTPLAAAAMQIRHLRLTYLVYTNGICLMARSSEYLQALIDNMAVYYTSLHVHAEGTVYVAETSMVMLQVASLKPFVRVPPPVAIVLPCNALLVERVDKSKYLGLHCHTYHT